MIIIGDDGTRLRKALETNGELHVSFLRRPGRSAVAAIALAAAVLAAPQSASAAPARPAKYRGTAEQVMIEDSYIVTLKNGTAGVAARATRLGGQVTRTYRSGFAVRMTAVQAAKLAGDAEVAAIEQNKRVSKSDKVQTPVRAWGLDRLDQVFSPMNDAYYYQHTGSNVHAYVLDTGIRTTHTEFGGRASHGWDFVGDDAVADDCDGHGTHVAGTIGGRFYGVAKEVKLVAVKVLDCEGNGDTAGLIAAIEWVTAHAVKPAVVNMSLGSETSAAVDAAVAASIASGITYAVAAGNNSADACGYSPAGVPGAITVGATDELDFRLEDSNYGGCVDLHAPGHHILSAGIGDDTGSDRRTGTSTASPHAAGAAALALASNPGWTPAQVHNHLVYGGTRRAVRNTSGYAAGTSDVLLYVGVDAAPQVTGLRSLVNGRNVTVGPDGTQPLRAVTSTVGMGDWNRFSIVATKPGYVSLAPHKSDRWVIVTDGGNGPLAPAGPRIVEDPWVFTDDELFQIVRHGDGTISLRSKLNGRYVTVPSDGESPLTAGADAVGVAEKFIWASLPGQLVLTSVANGQYVGVSQIGPPALQARGTSARLDVLDLGDDMIAFRARSDRHLVYAPADLSRPLQTGATIDGPANRFWLYHYGDGSVVLFSVSNLRFVQTSGTGDSPLTASHWPQGAMPDRARFTYWVMMIGNY
jgi:subtilisin family serine protease